MLLLRLALIVSMVRQESHALEILSEVEKSCKVSTDEGDLDLSPISNTNGTPRFMTSAYRDGTILLWNPCNGFNKGQYCKDAEACTLYSGGEDAYNIGTKDLSKFKIQNSKLYLTYHSIYAPNSDVMTIEMSCGDVNSKDTFVSGPHGSQTDCKLTSVHACLVKTTPSPPPKHISISLSPGSIICIIVLVVIIGYLSVGVVYTKVVRKATGKELIPNYSLWAGLSTNIETSTLKIIKVEEKSCKVSTDRGDLDLTAVSSSDGTSPKFSLPSVQVGAPTLLWNPCTEFSLGQSYTGDCQNAEVCDQFEENAIRIGTKALSKFETEDDKLFLAYKSRYNPTADEVKIEMVCGKSGTEDKLERGEGESLTGCRLTSVHACIVKATPSPPAKHKSTLLSAGSIMCIVLIAVIFVYVLAGVLYMKIRKDASGKKLCPNYTLWAGLPGDILAGAKYLFSCGKTTPKAGGGYENL